MKKIFSTMVVATALFTAYSAYNTQSDNELTGVALANIEALATSADAENSTENTVDCYSSSKSKKGASYYDCGPCIKINNAEGVGSTRTCIYKG